MNMIFKKFPAAALIDGEWVTSAKTFPVNDPATGDEVATVPDLGARDAVRAIDAAARALSAWSAKTAKERAAILRRWFDLITAETESLAKLMTTEQGKAARRSACRGRIWRLLHRVVRRRGQARLWAHDPDHRRVQALRHHQAADRRGRRDLALEFPDRHDHAKGGAGPRCRVHRGRQARGGDAALRACDRQAWQDAGLPAGVLNIVTTMDAPAVGKVFCDDGRVRKLSFTGSTEVGKILYRQCANTVKKLTLELGGNAPLGTCSTTPISTMR
jgi:succinate-semialdehyde dehydrogenase/glutarate-semialdehyde dehydrogenase